MEKSFTENDRKVQSKKAKNFSRLNRHDGVSFAMAIGAALIADFGASPSAIKRVARLASTNERAVRNWFEGKNAPSGENLVVLMRFSDAVFALMITHSGRGPLSLPGGLAKVRRSAVDLLEEIDRLEPPT